MNTRHDYLYGTAGQTKWEHDNPDPVDPDQDDYSDVQPKREDSEL
jgi:hypothetical protein